jgi:WD40 repeat protein
MQGSSRIVGIAFTPDGQAAITASGDGTIILWDINSGDILRRFGGFGPYASMALSPDGSQVAIGTWDRRVVIWDVATGTELHRLTGHDGNVTGVAFSPDGQTLVSVERESSYSEEDSLILWDVPTGQMRQRLTNTGAEQVIFSPDGRTLMTASPGGGFTLWDVATLSVRQVIPAGAASLAFSPDGNFILAASQGSITLFDTTTGQPIRRWRAIAHTFGSTVTFSPDGRRILTAHGTSIAVWHLDATTDRRPHPHDGHLNGHYLAHPTHAHQFARAAITRRDFPPTAPVNCPFGTIQFTPLPARAGGCGRADRL